MSHCASAPLASSWRWIAGSATLTTVPSMNAMLEPSTALTSVQRPALASLEEGAAVMRPFSAARAMPLRRPGRRLLPAEAHVGLGLPARVGQLRLQFGPGEQFLVVPGHVAQPVDRVGQRRVAILGLRRQVAVAQHLV